MKAAREFLVERKWTAAVDIAALSLVPKDGLPLEAVEPGAHIEVFIDRPGEPQLVRQYSLCNGPGATRAYLIAVKLESTSRGGSKWVHGLTVGDTVHLGEVRNLFQLAQGAKYHVLVAAGIGITPLLAMAQSLHASAGDYELHYFVRGEEHVALRDLLTDTELAGRLRLHIGLTPAEVQETLHRQLTSRQAGTHLYHCGPGPFMDLVETVAADLLPSDHVHSERFAAPKLSSPDAPSSTFVVKLHRHGLSCSVHQNQTIAQALAEAGVEIDLSCEQGVCGTCLTTVLEGEPDHKDAYLSKAERSGGSLILPCVSRSRSPVLVLDI